MNILYKKIMEGTISYLSLNFIIMCDNSWISSKTNVGQKFNIYTDHKNITYQIINNNIPL